MSETAPRAIAAGWYSDPGGSEQLRWWSGAAWTDYLAARPDPVLVAKVPDAIPEVPTQWNSVAGWLLALTPIIFLVVYLGALSTLASLPNFPLVILFLAVGMFLPYALTIIFAGIDRYRLGRYGYRQRASVPWVLLTPLAYLISRALKLRRAIGHGTGPLWTWIATWAVSSAIAGIVTVLLLPGITTAIATRDLAEGIQYSFNQAGGDYTVSCPATASVSIGSSFTCTALDAQTRTTHTISVHIVAGANNAPKVEIESVTPPLPG